MSRKKTKNKPKKKKVISWDDFTREDLIQIAKRYNEIMEEEKDKKEV